MKRYLIPILLFPLVCGCVVMGGGHEIVFDEEHRLPVRFASVAASDAFHDGLEMADPDEFEEAGGFVVFGLVAMGGEIFHETQFYNAQVRLADVDRDGVIDDAEASRYLRRMAERIEDNDED